MLHPAIVILLTWFFYFVRILLFYVRYVAKSIHSNFLFYSFFLKNKHSMLFISDNDQRDWHIVTCSIFLETLNVYYYDTFILEK
jgi:hypothetical protein